MCRSTLTGLRTIPSKLNDASVNQPKMGITSSKSKVKTIPSPEVIKERVALEKKERERLQEEVNAKLHTERILAKDLATSSLRKVFNSNDFICKRLIKHLNKHGLEKPALPLIFILDHGIVPLDITTAVASIQDAISLAINEAGWVVSTHNCNIQDSIILNMRNNYTPKYYHIRRDRIGEIVELWYKKTNRTWYASDVTTFKFLYTNECIVCTIVPKRKEKIYMQKECVLCLEKRATRKSAFNACGHACYCNDCWPETPPTSCPICRNPPIAFIS